MTETGEGEGASGQAEYRLARRIVNGRLLVGHGAKPGKENNITAPPQLPGEGGGWVTSYDSVMPPDRKKGSVVEPVAPDRYSYDS